MSMIRINEGPTAEILDSIEEHNRFSSTGSSHEHTFYFIHVRKGRDEAKIEIENPLYTVSLDRTKGTRLGLKLDVQVATRSLYIKEVIGGLAFTWNTSNVEQKVRPGDRILRVNAVEGNAHALMEECKQCVPLELELHRGSAIPVMAGLRVTMQVPFANFQPGDEGSVTKVDEEGDALIKIPPFGNQWVGKQDYEKLAFEDSERFYLKRYCDFKDLFNVLKAKIDAGSAEIVQALPEFPPEERFGFRRHLASFGMSSFMIQRREGLQKFIMDVLKQVSSLESEPAVGEFFGAHPTPEVGAATKQVLKQRLGVLVAKHCHLDE